MCVRVGCDGVVVVVVGLELCCVGVAVVVGTIECV